MTDLTCTPISGVGIVCASRRRSCWACDASQPHTPDKTWIVTPKGHTYCTLECHDEWEEFLRNQEANRACCPECGFDQQEHNDGCSVATSKAAVR